MIDDLLPDSLEDAIGICENCGQPSATLYEVRGYAGFYRFCPKCFKGEEEDES